MRDGGGPGIQLRTPLGRSESDTKEVRTYLLLGTNHRAGCAGEALAAPRGDRHGPVELQLTNGLPIQVAAIEGIASLSTLST